ncbi:MAG: hypothetical protein WDA53_07910 [Bacillota bacterium]
MNESSEVSGSGFLAALAAIAGLLSIIVVPNLGMQVADMVTFRANMVMEMLSRPELISAPKLVAFWYPFWSGLSVIAGVVLLLAVLPLARGEKRGRPMALGALFIPTTFGIYALWPLTFFPRVMFGQFAFGNLGASAKALIGLPAVIFAIGVIPFFIILLTNKLALRDKVVQFFAFLLLIFTTAIGFMNGHTALRLLWSNLLDNPQLIDKALAVGTVVNWLAVFLIIASIPFLSAGRAKGRWLSLMGILSLTMGNTILMVGQPTVWDYRVGTILALITLIPLFLPGVKIALTES